MYELMTILSLARTCNGIFRYVDVRQRNLKILDNWWLIALYVVGREQDWARIMDVNNYRVLVHLCFIKLVLPLPLFDN